ncbi:MAG TPA: hypothetical protein VD978_36270 [Azospirillum sp.]|nr:hypothetical protein [Azospirillum sp.]
MTKRPDNANGSPGNSHLRKQVDELVNRVPKHALRAVIDEVECTGTQNSERAQTLRGALVEQFNKLRPLKARRLFTSLFEPLLVDDPILYRTHDPIPGLIQRVDMGGLWHALSRFAFPDLAMRVQERLDTMSRNELLDRVLASPDAMVLRALMRDEAVRYLSQVLRTRRTAEEFLIAANREALRDARQRSPHLIYKAPIDLAQLAFVHAVLEENEAVLPLMERMRQDLCDAAPPGDAAPAELDGQTAIVLGFMRELRGACPNRGFEDPVVWLPPLLALNIKRRYDVVLRYMREYGGPAVSDNHPLHQALFGHFSACCAAMTDMIRTVFGDVAMADGQPLSLSRPVRETLNEARRRFEPSLNALNASGLMGTRLIGPRVRSLLGEVTRLLTSTVLPVVVDRTHAAAAARNAPAPDHDDLVWLLEFITAWGTTLGTVGYASPEIHTAKTRIVDDAGLAFIQATKAEEDDEALPARMQHIVRINQLLGAIGSDVTPWVSAMSQGLQRVVRHYLEDGSEITLEVQFVIDRLIAAIRNELGRSRHWQSADLVGLLRLYEARVG